WESNTICRYLVGLYQRDDLLPVEPAPRARVEQWIDWQAIELNRAWGDAFTALVRNNPDGLDAAQIAAAVQLWNDKMGLLEQQLAHTNAYVAGSEFTLADILIGLSVHRWQVTPMARPPYPAIAAYYQRLAQHAGFHTFALDGHN
ncbi:glutathione S-transferase C-terminal domain-containing protein, partial [Pseudomonas cedrina subsp. fulgida]|nr:glutathione S-transferase C-terminal domain-containing protein [Pseudomonas cedrina subsp. fulgida]